MALILSIETSTTVCSIAIHRKGALLTSQIYNLEKSHSSLLPGIIQESLINIEIDPSQLTAVAVSGGPGSYTGLRIGVSTAKGLCFAMGIPLIALDSLDIMYQAVRAQLSPVQLACPMMDARRMEVYRQVRNGKGELIQKTSPLIVEPNSFDQFQDQEILVFGDGAEKTLNVLQHKRLKYIPEVVPEARFMGKLAFQKFLKEDFEDLAYFEPEYLKPFRTIPPKKQFSV